MARELQSLAVSSDSSLVELGGRVDAYYRNANLRVALSEKLLNRLIPPPNMELAQVHELAAVPASGILRAFEFVSNALRRQPPAVSAIDEQ